MSQPDVVILGAGVIGLSLALEVHRRGIPVALYEPRAAASQASWAAAGMLAARDPFNPPALGELSRLSAALYPSFLEEVEELSGESVPFQTDTAMQHTSGGSVIALREHSIDPRQLALALLSAVHRAGIPLRQSKAPIALTAGSPSRRIIIHATGAWAESTDVFPRKGQMLRVRLPAGCPLREVHRSEHVYVVPRTQGPQAGTALVGATVENAGFDTETVPEDLAGLRGRGAALIPHIPELADSALTPMVEAWAGLRPATPDGLPLLGDLTSATAQAGPRHLIAAGHFRNGILLAPATAVLMADLIQDLPPKLNLQPFAPSRFTRPAAGIPGTGQS